MEWIEEKSLEGSNIFSSIVTRFTMGEYGVEYIEEIGSVLKEKAKY